ncbi:MAG TPA: hypothetical protein VKY27_06395 [Bacteriovoracaceae bacterium]|nr:hypothetical protein [Bacteriovoracaceae bacterium]
MKKLFLFLPLLISTSYASTLVCEYRAGDAIGGNKIKEVRQLDKNGILQFEHGSLKAWVHFFEGNLTSMMIESSKTFNLSAIEMDELVQNGRGQLTFQDIKNNGEYMSLKCEVQ